MGREVRLAPMENHTKGGMKKLLLCAYIVASTVPTFVQSGFVRMKPANFIAGMRFFDSLGGLMCP